jgi:hypothetical protein
VHQQALIALFSEHASLHGLSVKEFQGGFQYHQKSSGKYMKQLFAGDNDPYIFYMSWTLNKDNKLLFMKQMGECYVQKVEEIPGLKVNTEETEKIFLSTCCSAGVIIETSLAKSHVRTGVRQLIRDNDPFGKKKGMFVCIHGIMNLF